jgi:uncharacterized protein YfdQ (DUF2303 family)
MIDKTTLEALSQGPAIDAAMRAAETAMPVVDGILPLPDNFHAHDMEKLLQLRRRARGSMTTSAIEHFAAYVSRHAEAGASVFVDPDKMAARAVLNLGTPAAPGHADNTATFEPKSTASYRAMLAVASGAGKSQQVLAEFLEDWAPYVACFHGEAAMETKHAIAAVRKVTIESLSRSESTQEQLSATRSAFDQVKATSGDGVLPTRIEFVCEPYVGMSQRTFAMRLAILTGGKAPELTLRVIKAEEHAEAMATELVEKVSDAIGESVPVLIGVYSAKA